jgi:hypothetical protein
MRRDANGATGANAAASIGMRGLLEAVRRNFPWVMAAPADKREHALPVQN